MEVGDGSKDDEESADTETAEVGNDQVRQFARFYQQILGFNLIRNKTSDIEDRGMFKLVSCRLRDPGSWLPLAVRASLRNLGPICWPICDTMLVCCSKVEIATSAPRKRLRRRAPS